MHQMTPHGKIERERVRWQRWKRRLETPAALLLFVALLSIILYYILCG